MLAPRTAARCFVAIAAALGGCGNEPAGIETERDAGGATSPVRFTEVSGEVGLDATFAFADGVTDDFWNDHPSPKNELIAMIGGVACADVDGDGFLDLFVLGGDQGARWFRNTGNGDFENVDVGIDDIDPLSSGPLFADFDGDAKPDLLLGGIGAQKIRLLRNDGGFRFSDVTATSGLSQSFDTVGFGVGDADGDGDLDLVAARWGQFFYPSENDPALQRTELFWLNDGNGHFTDHSELLRYPLRSTRFTANGELSEVALTPNFADLDGDGDSDLVLTQDFGVSTVLRNDTVPGELPRFIDITDRNVINENNGMGASLGDYDNDGDLDWFVTSISAEDAPSFVFHTGNRLYRNDGTGRFDDVTDEADVRSGSWGWASCFADFDSDGWLDVFHVNGWGLVDPSVLVDAPEFLSDRARLFLSDSARRGHFIESAAGADIDDDGQGRGVVCFDYDRDGDVDVLVTNTDGPVRLYRNDSDSVGNWVHVVLDGPIGNAAGIGARVELTTELSRQVRQVRIQNNYVSQDPAEAHFGLGSASTVETLRVVWPDGAETVRSNVEPNHLERVRYGE